jgi:hypothetical protein
MAGSASLGLGDYSQVDMLGLPVQICELRSGKEPGIAKLVRINGPKSDTRRFDAELVEVALGALKTLVSTPHPES